MSFLASLPHITQANPLYAYVVFIGSLAIIVGSLVWDAIPKWLAVILTMVCMAAAMETRFGPWLGHYLQGWTNGFLGKS